MSSNQPPKGGKPFLGDDDLQSELDAWDEMFDGLHTESAVAAEEPLAAAPAPAPAPDPVAPASALVQPFDDGDLDEQMTLDRAVQESPTIDVEPITMEVDAEEPFASDPRETDFSDLGAEGEPAALGDILGSSPHLRAPTAPPRDFDEDEVFTSASRPRFETSPVAPPAPQPTPTVRRAPAIVRRAPVVEQDPETTPARGVNLADFGGDTRVQTVDEMEAQRAASRARSEKKTLPPPMAFAEDEYEIEVDSSPGAYEPIPVPEPALDASISRRTAHVVRRAETPARTQPTAPPPVAASAPVAPPPDDDELAFDLADDPPPPAPAVLEIEPTPNPTDADRALGIDLDRSFGLESDFSDVAAAVGAEADPVVPEPIIEVDAVHVIGEEPAPASARPPARPPALIDVYPRVKTPTSVPPIGDPLRDVLDIGGEEAGAASRPRRIHTALPVEAEPSPEPSFDPQATHDLQTAVRGWPELVAPLTPWALDEAAAATLQAYERELATVDDSSASASLRIEAGRLSERIGDLDRARAHYDAALLADPRATTALRGLRRIARSSGDLVDAVRQLDAEIAVAGALERRPLAHYRVDLLLASNEQDLARVAVGELLDQAGSDVRALLAQLELAFLDGRAQEFGSALEQLAAAMTDAELRAALQSARGALAAQHDDVAGAATWFARAAESDPASLSARFGAVRHAAAQGDREAAARALVALAQQLASNDPITAAAAAVRAHELAPAAPTASTAAALAGTSAGHDPLVARLAAAAALSGSGTADDDLAAKAHAFAHWSQVATSPAERGFAAARAAELDAARAGELWAFALANDPGDDYAAAQLRTAHVVAEATQAAIDVDLAIVAAANPGERERACLRAAYGLIAQGKLDEAITLLEQSRAARPGSLAIGEALGEALAAADRWAARAKLFAEIAAEPGDQLDREVAQLRSALAWEEAVGAAAASDPPGEDLGPATVAALEAWEHVLARGADAPGAHAAAIVLASRLGDREVLAEVLARAQHAERSPWAATSLGLRRARLFATDDAPRAETIVRELAAGTDDPRKTVALVLGAARQRELADAAAALEDRASQVEGHDATWEAATLRLRAAQIALDAGDAARATSLLARVEQALPQVGVIGDLLSAARRRAGDRPSAAARRAEGSGGISTADAFARVVRDADLAAAQGDGPAALALYQRALELRPGDPLAAVPLVRLATQLRDPAPISALALAQLHAAEEAQDGVAKATAYELLAHIDGELRNDQESAQIALESASQADPSRLDLVHRLERRYAAADQLADLLRLRRAQLDTIGREHARDRGALLVDLTGLMTRDGSPELEVADQYRAALDADPSSRLALMHLEAIVRRSGFTAELAQLEEKIAVYFTGDPRTQAAFWTRAGETLTELGQIEEAVKRFSAAEDALPGHAPALEGWRFAALKGERWADVADAASRQAAVATDTKVKARLYHLAGVALMDKALVGEQAMVAFQRALEADPSHRDAFLRLRILLEEDANHDDLATLLAKRLDVEQDVRARVDLHRALAELHRNFLSDRDTAKVHYRAILASDPNDLRAHAAIADIAWEQGNWQEAADALTARARLEREPEILKTLCFRLGLIYADRIVDIPMALKAFQRALTYQPDDENTLVRLADLAVQASEWKLALGACERLIKNESDPEKRVAYLHRVATIFKDGFNDTKRAERALNLALDGAPTSEEALAAVVQFYRDARDLTSARVQLNRVAGTMRVRAGHQPADGTAYRVISRAMVARAGTGLDSSLRIARAAAELAALLGVAEEPEQRLVREASVPDAAPLVRPDADDLLFPRGVQLELRQIFQLLGDRIAKHVGVDLRPYGLARGDRLRARDNATASTAQNVAASLGFGEIDVYVSNRQPWAMVAEPTSPVSLVIGSSLAAAGPDAIRFAAGAALKLAQAQLAIPARLSPDELGVLVTALLRLFQPEFPIHLVDGDAVAAQVHKLRRLIPTGMLTELRPYAFAIDPQTFDHRVVARDLRIAALRAGLVASGSLVTGLRIVASQAGGELPGFLSDPVAQGLIAFALGEDHAAVAR